MVDHAELLNCPFCGGRAEIKVGGYTKYVACLNCEVMGPNLKDDGELIAAWNTRAALEARAPEAEWMASLRNDIEQQMKDFPASGYVTIPADTALCLRDHLAAPASPSARDVVPTDLVERANAWASRLENRAADIRRNGGSESREIGAADREYKARILRDLVSAARPAKEGRVSLCDSLAKGAQQLHMNEKWKLGYIAACEKIKETARPAPDAAPAQEGMVERTPAPEAGCPNCGNSDLNTIVPLTHHFPPTQYYRGGNKLLGAKCQMCGHEWDGPVLPSAALPSAPTPGMGPELLAAVEGISAVNMQRRDDSAKLRELAEWRLEFRRLLPTLRGDGGRRASPAEGQK